MGGGGGGGSGEGVGLPRVSYSQGLPCQLISTQGFAMHSYIP